jgi:hypothetical protein
MMKRWLIPVASLLLLSLLTPTLTAQASSAQSKTDEMLSSIADEKWYLGSDVKAAIRSLTVAWQAESEATARAAAAEAVKACVSDLAATRQTLQVYIADRDNWRLAAVAGLTCAGVLAVVAALAILIR